MLAARPASYQSTHAKRQNYDKLQAQLRVRLHLPHGCHVAAAVFDQSGLLQDAENIHPDKLLTDRTTYIGYLESQLERVTNACLTVQSFDQRIETVASAARLLEEKVDICKLLACATAVCNNNAARPWHTFSFMTLLVKPKCVLLQFSSEGSCNSVAAGAEYRQTTQVQSVIFRREQWPAKASCG